VTDKIRKKYGNNVRFYRIVKGKDAVTTLPPKILGFDHLADPTVIEDDGKILLIKNNDDLKADLTEIFGSNQEKDLKQSVEEATKSRDVSENEESPVEGEQQQERVSTDEEEDAKYNRVVTKIPKAFRDHMPDFYLKPIFKAQGIENGSNFEEKKGIVRPIQEVYQEMKKTSKKVQKKWVPKMFREKKAPIEKVEPTYF